jgi:hypothetical protein
VEGKMGFRLSLFAFSALICVLTGLSLAWTVYSEWGFYVWAVPLLALGWVFAFAFAFDYLLNKRGFSVKRLLLLAFCLIVASSGVTHAVWIVATPRWSFTLSTDRSTYVQNETVQITVTLKNVGYLTQSFLSTLDHPIIVDVWTTDLVGGYLDRGLQVWYSPVADENQTMLTISPGQSLIRTFAWNQTPIYNTQPPTIVAPGTYIVEAFVPDPEFYPHTQPYLSPFWAETTINITSTG